MTKAKLKNKKKNLSEAIGKLKRNIRKKYFRSLLFDVLLAACLILVLVLSFVIVFAFWTKLGNVLPFALETFSKIANDPSSIGEYSEDIDVIEKELNSFIYVSVTAVLFGSLLAFLCYSFFQHRVFDILAEKREERGFWKFLVLNMILFLFFIVTLFILLFVTKAWIGAVGIIFVFLFFLFWTNVSYFAFRKKTGFWRPAKTGIRMMKCFNISVFICLVILFWIGWMLLMALFLGFPSALLLISLVWFIVFLPFGRIVLYSANEVVWNRAE